MREKYFKMSASNSRSESKGNLLIFDLKYHILFIGYQQIQITL